MTRRRWVSRPLDEALSDGVVSGDETAVQPPYPEVKTFRHLPDHLLLTFGTGVCEDIDIGRRGYRGKKALENLAANGGGPGSTESLGHPWTSPNDDLFFLISLPSASHGPPRLPWHLGPQGSGIVPTLSPQVFGIYVNPGYGPMAPPAVHCCGGDARPENLVLPLQTEFHARKALNRHIDDMRSGKTRKSCDYPNCDFTYVRKAQNGNHLQKVHGKAPPPRRRAAQTAAPNFPLVYRVLLLDVQ
ncbi:hypothetical protein BGW80DRAFT_1449561 [Lactifluus volemus]|nr:hypothetical protein BGW80DRAFT_1449561 [Lactifluus volemus]